MPRPNFLAAAPPLIALLAWAGPHYACAGGAVALSDGSPLPAAHQSVGEGQDGALKAPNRGVPAKVYRYVHRLIAAYDSNHDGQLQPQEWGRMHGQPAQIDSDGDQRITPGEFTDYILRFAARRRIRLMTIEVGQPSPAEPLLQPASQPAAGETGSKTPPETPSPEGAEEDSAPASTPARAGRAAVQRRRDLKFFIPASRLPKGLPAWFHQRDRDGDGQLTLAEFAPDLAPDELTQFDRYDQNRDGVVTAEEMVRQTSRNRSSAGQRRSPARRRSAP